MCIVSRIDRLVPALAVGLLLASTLAAQVRKLSPPPERGPSGSVMDALVTPDGRRVVYVERSESHGVPSNRFFVVSDGGVAPLASVGRGGVNRFAISPDGGALVYWQSDADNAGSALFGLSLEGNAVPRRLSPPPEIASRVDGFEITPQRVAVFRMVTQDGTQSLWAATLGGREPAIQLGGPTSTGDRVNQFVISPDGRWVAYTSNQDGAYELYLVPTSGASAPRKLNAALLAPEQVGVVRFSPSSERVVFVLTRTTGNNELYSAAVDEVAPAVLLDPSGTSHGPSPFEIAPDSRSVVYLDFVGATAELFRVPVKGDAAPTRVNAPLVANGRVEAFAIAADGSVVYQADQEVNNRVELYHAPLERPVHRLSAPSGENQDVTFFQLAPDSNRVLYATTRPQRLFLTTLDGSIAPVALTGVPLGPNAQPYTLDAGGAHLVFSDAVGLWSLRLDGVSMPIELVHSEPDAHVGGNLLGLADGRVVTWITSFDWSSDLYTVPIDGGAEPQRISAPLPLERALDSALALELAPDGRRTVFAFGRYEVTRLYTVDFVPRSAPVQLAAQCEHSWFRISPDSAWVVFRTVEGLLSSVAIDGSTPPSPIDAVPTTAEVGFSPDGRRVFYLDALRRLHSAPLDGSSAPVLLDGFPEESSVTFDGYRVSPDASRVVYLFQVPGEDGTRLLSAPVDGSAPALELDPLHRVDRLIDFGADGRIVVSTTVGFRVSLWSAVADGSEMPTFLASTFLSEPSDEDAIEVDGEHVYFLAINGGVLRVPVAGHETPLSLTPGWNAGQLEVAGGRAFFLAMPDGQHVDLYSVPGDGSAAPVRLSRAPFGVTIDGRRTTSDGARVVYRQVEDVDIGLYATAGDGSTEPVRLSPLITGWEQRIAAASFALSADGRSVAFAIDTEDFSLETSTEEVFVAPSDGRNTAVVVNEPPPGGNSVADFRLDPDGRFVLFIADRDEPGVYELFLAPLRSPANVLVR